MIQKKYRFAITGPGAGAAEALDTIKDELGQADFVMHQIYPDGYSLDDPLLIARLLEAKLRDIARREIERHRVDEVTLEKFSLPSLLPDVFIDDHISFPTRSWQESTYRQVKQTH